MRAIATYKSRSSDLTHTVYLDSQGRVAGCTCPGWFHAGKCWHVTEQQNKAAARAEAHQEIQSTPTGVQ